MKKCLTRVQPLLLLPLRRSKLTMSLAKRAARAHRTAAAVAAVAASAAASAATWMKTTLWANGCSAISARRGSTAPACSTTRRRKSRAPISARPALPICRRSMSKPRSSSALTPFSTRFLGTLYLLFNVGSLCWDCQPQWSQEIARHSRPNSLNVLVYRGVRQQSVSSSPPVWLDDVGTLMPAAAAAVAISSAAPKRRKSKAKAKSRDDDSDSEADGKDAKQQDASASASASKKRKRKAKSKSSAASDSDEDYQPAADSDDDDWSDGGGGKAGKRRGKGSARKRAKREAKSDIVEAASTAASADKKMPSIVRPRQLVPYDVVLTTFTVLRKCVAVHCLHCLPFRHRACVAAICTTRRAR